MGLPRSSSRWRQATGLLACPPFRALRRGWTTPPAARCWSPTHPRLRPCGPGRSRESPRKHSPAEASVLAMVGTGGQAMSLVEACAAVRPIRQVLLASLHRASAEDLRSKLCALRPDLDVRICESVKEAVKDASIVCLATTSVTALVEDSDVRSDVHINAVGAFRPDMRELGICVLAAATLVCSDDPHGALREAGDLMEAAASGALNPGTPSSTSADLTVVTTSPSAAVSPSSNPSALPLPILPCWICCGSAPRPTTRFPGSNSPGDEPPGTAPG